MTEGLRFNPRAMLTLEQRAGEVVAITAKSPVKGAELRRARVERAHEPAVVDLLERVARGSGEIVADLDDASWQRLAEMGLLIPEAAVSDVVRFRCAPLDPPADPYEAPRGALVVEPSLRYRDEPGPPAEVPGAPPGAASPFVEDCASAVATPDGVPLPLFLTIPDAGRALFRSLVPGGPEPADLAPETRARLASAGVLVDPDDAAHRSAVRARAEAEAREQLQRARYVVVRDLAHSAQLAALRRYHRELVAEGYLPLGDRQVGARYAAPNEPLARVLHHRLAGFVSAIAGAPMKASYSYSVTYLPGATLARHRDREPCELTISMLVDETPEPDESGSLWPLHVEAGGGSTSVRLGLGDGLLFHGRELAHWRHALPEGMRSTSILFHFVPESFTGKLL